jgi:hypothetical protein
MSGLALLCVLALLGPLTPGAEDPQVPPPQAPPAQTQTAPTFGYLLPQVTESFYGDYHYDPTDGNWWSLRNRLNGSLASRDFYLSARLDAEKYLSGTTGKAATDFHNLYRDEVRLEKVTARLGAGNSTMELGDYYVCLGKGMALCFQRVDELAMDTSLRGGKASLRSGPLEGLIFAGLANPVNAAEQVETYIEDSDDVLGGASLGAALGPIKLALHGAGALFRDGGDELQVGVPTPDSHQTAGAALTWGQLPARTMLSVEGDLMQSSWVKDPGGTKSLAEYRRDGWVVYGALNSNPGPFHVLLETRVNKGLDENDALLQGSVKDGLGKVQYLAYSQLPPLEDEGLFLRPGFYDSWAARGRLDFTLPGSDSSVFLNLLEVRDLVPDERLTAGTKVVVIPHDSYARHLYGGLEYRQDDLGITGTLQGGLRREREDIATRHEWTMWHAGFSAEVPVVGRHSLDLSGRSEQYLQDSANLSDFSIRTFGAGWTMAPWVSLSYLYEYSDQPGVTLDRQHHHGVQASWRFLPGSYIKVFAGSTRGGLRCSGGLCRTFPEFEGVRTELTLRF